MDCSDDTITSLKNIIVVIGILFPLLATAVPVSDTNALSIVPLPKSVERHAGIFKLSPKTRIEADAASMDSGLYLADQLHKSTGYKIKVVGAGKGSPQKGDISLITVKAGTNMDAEGYELSVSPESVVIRGADSAGTFYGVQTLLELLPPAVYSAKPAAGMSWTVPCVEIQDAPRFKWRGYMLDVSRHFFNKEEIKSTLDFMAMHKLNVFHWHLVDDHGWRLEIKKYPLLTKVGAWRKGIGFEIDPKESTAYGPDGRYGGFYTQDDAREIVAYAASRHITVLPEIEMPGHSTAALMAYPQYSCKGGPFDTDLDAGIFKGIYCPGNEETFKFLDDILAEVMDVFPSRYIHIGGDEVPKDSWQHCAKCQALMAREGLKSEHELQSYFVKRMESFVTAHGRSLIGWSEISEGGLAKSATVMDWNGGGAEAASSGHDVVMAAQVYYYLCYYQSLDRTDKLKAQRPCLPLEKVYAFEPVPAALAAEGRAHIIGTEACMWTVFFASLADVEEMTFPRLCAFAESAWSPAELKKFGNFESRLEVHEKRLAASGINYWEPRAMQIGEWKRADLLAKPAMLEWNFPKDFQSAGTYRLSLNYQKGRESLKVDWAALLENGHEISRDTHPGLAGLGYNRPVKAKSWNYFLNLPKFEKGAKYSVQVSVAAGDGADSSGLVFLEPPKESSK